MTTEPTITERGYAMLEQIKKECGLVYDPPEPVASKIDGDGAGVGMPGVAKPHRNIKPFKPWNQWRKIESLIKPGEILFSQWVRDEVKRTGYARGTIESRYYDGYYRGHIDARKDGKFVFIKGISEPPKKNNQPRPGEIPMKMWIRNKADELGIAERTAWVQYYRGTLPGPAKRRAVNIRLVYVIP